MEEFKSNLRLNYRPVGHMTEEEEEEIEEFGDEELWELG